MTPLGTLNSGYIMNQSEPQLAVAFRKNDVFTGDFFEKEEFNDFTVYLFRSKQYDEKRYKEWIDLIKSHYSMS